MRAIPKFEPVVSAKLRCVEVVPRHVSLLDLEPGDCRYPYGGEQEGEAITFCAHPRRAGSSYCASHFQLTWGPGTVSERTADAFLLWALGVA
jgi:GcrA cell cycle regulator